ncbi:MAG: hypothetical protein MJ010_06160 [Paludibacteraceae bacterium]|nr:hypothetical protein [Paludibacteraceae bacterium]
MASKRGLKKDLNYLYSDLMLDAFATFCNKEKKDEEKTAALLNKISDNYADFIKRVNCTDGKENKKIVKAYYKKLGESILQDVLNLSEEIDKL